jgi:CpeT protein
MMLRPFALLPLAFLTPACAPGQTQTQTPPPSSPAGDANPEDDVDAVAATPAAEMARLLTGRFDSSAQEARDNRYFGVQLRACPVDAPALGEHVLYVEQAILTAVDEPYRQRIYVISEDGDAVVSAVRELDAPEQVIGLCDSAIADRNDAVEQRTVTPLEGCEVVLLPSADGFSGTTRGEACLNSYSGATYATSEVSISETQVKSWDRGYDASGTQVWGAMAGAYVFDRVGE